MQQKIETNLEKVLGNSLNIHLQQQMGSFQTSMLEAFQSLREELTAKKQTEVDQTSFSASKPGTSSTAVNLDLSPPRHRNNIETEDMDVDYGPALPARLVPDPHDTSDQYVATSELPPKKVSDKPKKHSHSRSRHEIESRSASDQSNEESDEPRIPSTKPKKHSDKSKHKSRSRYVSSSSGEDQFSVARHRSLKPSGAQPSGAVSDQDLPQHDPDPPYYREVALSDIPSQYAEKVDTFRSILALPLCLGPQLQSWVWTMRKAVKSSDLEVLPLFFHLGQLSRTPLINFNMTLRLLIYLRVNTSSLLHPLLSGTGWDSPVVRTNIRS